MSLSPSLLSFDVFGTLAIVSKIDDDLLAATPLRRPFDLICTAERAQGYKPDGRLFTYLIQQAGVAKEAILHSGQSQLTDLLGGKRHGLTVAWINRRGIALDPSVPKPDYILPDIASLLPLPGGAVDRSRNRLVSLNKH